MYLSINKIGKKNGEKEKRKRKDASLLWDLLKSEFRQAVWIQ